MRETSKEGDRNQELMLPRVPPDRDRPTIESGGQREFVLQMAPALEDEILGRIWALGSTGAWSEQGAGTSTRLHAFYAPVDEHEAAELRTEMDALPGCVLLSDEWVPARDWARDYRVSARPIEVGRFLLVDPREPDAERSVIVPAERTLLRLPARTAFGMGSHESTRLAVELLEEAAISGLDVIDVGAGSGILSFAALILGARRVLACDVDAAAALLLPQYMALNAMRFEAICGTLAALELEMRRFDVALVNVVPSEIEPDLPALAGALRSGGRAIFSGILAADAEVVETRLGRLGFVEASRRSAGEWIAYSMELQP